MKGVKTMANIIDERQTGHYRLLILDKEFPLKNQGQAVNINGKRFNAFSVHGIKNAVAVRMPKGYEVSFTGLAVNADE